MVAVLGSCFILSFIERQGLQTLFGVAVSVVAFGVV
jgi:hypothetical protein